MVRSVLIQKKITSTSLHFSDQNMDYRERPEFNPSEHGLSPGFRLTNFSKLKG